MARKFSLLFLSLFLSSQVFSATSVTRNLPDGYVAGTTFQVTLTVIPDHVVSIVIREYLPQGWTIVSSTPPYSTYIPEDNRYKWLNYSTNPIDVPYQITYTVSVPAGDSGDKVFTGSVVDDYGTYNIVGDTVILDNSTVSTPQFSPPPGSYASAQSVAITCSTSGASIRYTTDGSDPTETSTIYTTPVAVNTTTTIKARAFKEGMNPSQ
ncbi:MAG TPA: chitobiase/beta-hexosaminidase C-terminal domain-containing protein, partial [bacterium]|nr:chitobiase/beta-hexosaminidase C-terminal domain-containing protein [bacterium]